MPLTPVVSDLARRTMRTAFEELERTVTTADSRAFRSTTFLQVRIALLDIENQLGARQALRNMGRLTPFLSGLEHYAKAVETLCNGTPFLSWIWSPISLILRVASEYVEAFEQIMKGYSRVSPQAQNTSPNCDMQSHEFAHRLLLARAQMEVISLLLLR